MRSEHDCIITTVKTVIDDNPTLNCRISGLEYKSPSKIILDKNLIIPLNANIIKNLPSKTTIFYNKINNKKIKILKKNKIKTKRVSLDREGNLNLKEVLLIARKFGFFRVFVEAGKKLSINLLKNNLVDDLNLFVSNKMLKKYGKNNIKKDLNNYIKNKRSNKVQINLLGDELLTFNINNV
jgi:diaminohydroxyphosphoribosylaminopyrimidine deaminase / 5-amino-6-(5-phosphoribosylamino)uracil reductase